MKKSYVLLLAPVLLLQISFAQSDAGAKKILDAVSAKVKASKGVTGNFALKSITSKGKPNGTKTGNICIKGEKYILKQGKTEVICDGAKTYSYDGNKTITVTSTEEASETLSPQKLLSGSYDKEYGYKLVGSKGNSYEIEMKPNDSRKSFQKVSLFVDKSKNMITKAVIFDKGDNTLELSISNMNTNATLQDNLFIFNKAKYPPDTEILD